MIEVVTHFRQGLVLACLEQEKAYIFAINEKSSDTLSAKIVHSYSCTRNGIYICYQYLHRAVEFNNLNKNSQEFYHSSNVK